MEKYQSKDFYLCGFLISEGQPLRETYRENGFTIFIFDANQELHALIAKYYQSKAKVDPAVYGQTLRQLKGLMHSLVSTNNQYNYNDNNFSKGNK